jgi:hypothetical protein
MTGRKPATPKPPDPRDQLEVLRSVLVADVVIAALEHASGEPEGDYAVATAAILKTTATELREWHAPKAEQNGAV